MANFDRYTAERPPWQENYATPPGYVRVPEGYVLLEDWQKANPGKNVFEFLIPQKREGYFDDLVPQKSGGFFDDLVPQRGPWNDYAPPRDAGRLGAIAEGAKAGATFNFADELAGASAASGVPGLIDKLPVAGRLVANAITSHPLVAAGIAGAGGVRLGYEHLTDQPKGEATKAYETARDETRARQKTAQEEYPGAYLGGELGGSFITPLPGALLVRGATLPTRMATGMVTGAGVGGLSGFGAGESVPDRLVKGAGGALLGAGIGAVAPPALEGVIQGTRALANPVLSAVRGATTPGNEAARRVVTAIERDARADPQAVGRLTPQEYAAARAAGEPVTIMDMGGEVTRGLGRWAANLSPEGRGALNRTIDDRFEGQAGRFTDWLRGAFHYPDAHAQRQAIEQTAKTVNRTAYLRAEQEAAKRYPGGIWDEGFEQISQAPVVQDAIRKASITGGNRAAREGFTPIGNPFIADPATGRMVLRTNPDGSRAVPNLRFWDEVKKNLDATRSGDAQSFARVLREHLDQLVPAYGKARAGAAHFFGAGDALEAGQNFVGASQRLGLREAQAVLAKMSPTEQRLFQDGYVSRFIERLEASGDRRNILNKIASSPGARRELTVALGPQRANELEARLRVEGVMDMARGAV